MQVSARVSATNSLWTLPWLSEHYKTPVWNQWDWYPIVQLELICRYRDISLQLSLSSDKDYPDYWAVQDAVSYIGGGYSELHGNPLLKPAQEYELKMTYILKSKYIFSAWFNHTKDYSVQTLYQSSDVWLKSTRHSILIISNKQEYKPLSHLR